MSALINVTCHVCSKPIETEPVRKTRAADRQPIYLHKSCWEELQAARDQQRLEEQRIKIERRTRAIEEAFRNNAGWSTGYNAWTGEHDGERHKQPGAGLPRWEWARFDNAEFRERVNKKLLTSVEAYSGKCSALIVAKTGTGKTALLVAWLCRERERAINDGTADWLAWFGFYAAHEIVTARRNWQLGEESPLIERAKSVQFLVLDEVGYEPVNEALFDVVDARYKTAKPTVVTSGLTHKDFGVRYGGAFFRRLTESGQLIVGPA